MNRLLVETKDRAELALASVALDEAGEALEKFPYLKIEVEGHTDTRGSDAYNQRLSQARAESVRDYLLGKFQLTASHYAARGYGESRPETKERNEEELLRNRRVVLTVTNPEELPKGVKVEHRD
jgi:OOP family OmpA-OmpF porin